ncbi:MAG: peroxidase family protein, partial [Burkholderiales bacterium]
MKTRAVHGKHQLNQAGRRKFLGTLGAGVAAFGGSGLFGAPAALANHQSSSFEEDFGRMFPHLEAFFGDRPPRGLNDALVEIGRRGGVLDAGDALPASADPAVQAQAAIDLILNPALNVNNPNNTTHTAGTTFMGQFMDHDMTFDQTSVLGEETDPDDSPNTRSPTLDLDSVYGGGPERSRHLYGHEGSKIKLKVGVLPGSGFEDLPRDSNGVAILGDPRNDENLMLAELHAAFLLFHNRAVDYVKARDRRKDDDEVFDEARKLTRWHYQWMIVHEFLPLFIGKERTNRILDRGRRFYRPREAFMPVEFQGAAYRFGHTMIRPSYRANRVGNAGRTEPGSPAFFGMIFDPAGQGQADPVDLRGGGSRPRRFIGWETFFDFGLFEFGSTTPAVKPNKIIDARISSPLFLLPTGTIAGFEEGQPISLPARNLLRGVTWSLPSGQKIAREIDGDPIEVPQFRDFGFNLHRSTPLWAYCLHEGFVQEKGLTLGQVGGTIVGEVIIGLLELDRRSYLAQDFRWKPTLPQRDGKVTGDFRMVDFLTFAG